MKKTIAMVLQPATTAQAILPSSLRLSYVALLAFFLGAVPCLADERDDKIRALEKRLEHLEKLLESQPAKPAPPAETAVPADKPKPGPSVSIGASGFSMSSADTNFVIRFRGLLQVDSRWDLDSGDGDGFILRRARPILEGTVFRDFDYRFTPEFGGSSTTIRDAWLNYRYDDPLQFRVGKMKSPANLERWQSIANNAFIERSLVSLLWPVRDLGFLLHGELWRGDEDTTKSLAWEGLANYEVGVFNGAGDARAAGNSDFDDNRTAAARVFVHPFLKSHLHPLEKLGLGVSGTYGDAEGGTGLPDDFDYAAGVIANGTHWRVGPQVYWYWGPFGLLGEYTISSQRLERQTAPFDSARADNTAWSVTASWMLTREDATFRTLTPRKNFDPRAGGWGAWQIVARYASLDIDDDVFPTIANPAELPTSAQAWGVGLNWYLNRNIRTAVNFDHTDFKGGQSGFIGGMDVNVFSTRVQLAF